MIIRIKTSGHQYYSEIKGEVIRWSETAEYYISSNKHLQVPAVVIRMENDTVEVISLSKEYFTISIDVLQITVAEFKSGGYL